MKIGMVSQSVLKRSVLKPLASKREEVLIEPTVEEVCTGIKHMTGKATLTSSTTIYGDDKDIGVYAIAKVVNNIASRGGETIGIDVNIQLPPHAYESRLKSMVTHMEACCQKHSIQIMGIKVSVNPVVCSSIIYVSAIGSV